MIIYYLFVTVSYTAFFCVHISIQLFITVIHKYIATSLHEAALGTEDSPEGPLSFTLGNSHLLDIKMAHQKQVKEMQRRFAIWYHVYYQAQYYCGSHIYVLKYYKYKSQCPHREKSSGFWSLYACLLYCHTSLTRVGLCGKRADYRECMENTILNTNRHIDTIKVLIICTQSSKYVIPLQCWMEGSCAQRSRSQWKPHWLAERENTREHRQRDKSVRLPFTF